MSKNPKYRKTKRYTNRLATKIFTIDDARNIVLKIKQLEGVSQNTIYNYEKLFNDFDRFYGDKTDIASLTKDDAREFIYWQLNEKVQFLNHKYRKVKPKGVSVSSANTYVSFAKASFTVLVNEEIVEENIFENANHIKEKDKKIDTLTVKEISQFLRSLNKGWYSEFRMFVLVHTLLDSFGRINEVLSVRKGDIDFVKHAITFQNTKNGKLRIVPISKKTVKLLEELIEETDDFNSEYLFLTHHGNPLSPDTARKHLRDLSKRAGLEHITGFHIFRHTASEMFLRQNGSMRVLQKILGHSEISTTSIYAHVLDQTIKQQHEQFSPLNLIDDKEKRKTRTGRKNK
ncbi:tyrosine-type recombinase/integrase [Cytobacillus firmus]|uniref:tyrosine-type recombinase/integrase n=1 Tax=Cytobacillus firmus TaxID=1399 RepID=UPI002041A850|nr:tyrosine-type recombinase/integrase [Cytobacillus firmus]MCM3704812.1 tyrosine-type recombinase/integrase [Cytobacillus firmus]